MSDEPKKPGPVVQAVVKPTVSKTIVPTRRPVSPGPSAVNPVTPKPRVEVVPAQRAEVVRQLPFPVGVSAHVNARKADATRAGPRAAPASRARLPLTPENIALLAKQERVPARIAKGELEGKMKARVWKKLHAEEAKRFDQAYTLMGEHPTLELADAFGIVQSGMGVEEFLQKRARAKKKEVVKLARTAVAGDAIDAFIQALIGEKAELSLVLAESTVIDRVTEARPVSLVLERTAVLEKLNIVVLTRKPTWEALLPSLERDPKLTQRPAGVSRQPSRRPVSDPRLFTDLPGKTLALTLRNGLLLKLPLLAVGPYDLLLGEAGRELLVPLHALLSWSTVGS